MKSVRLFVLMLFFSVSPAVVAVTMGSTLDQTSSVKNEAVQNKFGLSGTITRYLPSRSIIEIDGISYLLRGKGRLRDADLVSKRKIKFNLEKLPSEKMGRITRIWIEGNTEK